MHLKKEKRKNVHLEIEKRDKCVSKAIKKTTEKDQTLKEKNRKK